MLSHDVVITAFSSLSSSSSLKTCVVCFFVDISLQEVGVDKEVVGHCAVLFLLFLFCFFRDVTGSAAVVGVGRSKLSSS